MHFVGQFSIFSYKILMINYLNGQHTFVCPTFYFIILKSLAQNQVSKNSLAVCLLNRVFASLENQYALLYIAYG